MLAATGAAFAASGTEQDLVSKQSEIDKTVFEEKAAEIAEMGFTVTNTGVIDGAVEIGITPYSESYAEYLYGLFGKDDVRVVEGMQAIPYSAGEEPASTGIAQGEQPIPYSAGEDPAATGVADSANEGSMTGRQAEIDSMVFGDLSSEIEKMGFAVTHTSPVSDYVEVGITPYKQEYVDFLTEKLGSDVKVVEGEQAYTIQIESVKEENSGSMLTTALIFSVCAVAAAVVVKIIVRKTKASKN
jgi:hypothetical protein